MVAEASENLSFRNTFRASEQKPFENKGFRYPPEPLSMVSEIFYIFLRKILEIIGGEKFPPRWKKMNPTPHTTGDIAFPLLPHDAMRVTVLQISTDYAVQLKAIFMISVVPELRAEG